MAAIYTKVDSFCPNHLAWACGNGMCGKAGNNGRVSRSHQTWDPPFRKLQLATMIFEQNLALWLSDAHDDVQFSSLLQYSFWPAAVQRSSLTRAWILWRQHLYSPRLPTCRLLSAEYLQLASLNSRKEIHCNRARLLYTVRASTLCKWEEKPAVKSFRTSEACWACHAFEKKHWLVLLPWVQFDRQQEKQFLHTAISCRV